MTQSCLNYLSLELQGHVLSYTDYQTIAAARETESLADAATSPSVLANIFRRTHSPAAPTQRNSRRLGMALASIECAPVPLLTHTATQLTHSQELAALNDSITSLSDKQQTISDIGTVFGSVAGMGGCFIGLRICELQLRQSLIHLVKLDFFRRPKINLELLAGEAFVRASFTVFLVAGFVSIGCHYHSNFALANQLATATARRNQLEGQIYRTQDFWTLHDQLDPQTVVSEGYWTPEEAIQYELLHILLRLYPDLNDPGNDNRLIAFNLLMDWAQYVHAQRNNEIPRGAAFQGFDAWCVRNQNRRYVLHGTDSSQSLRQYSYRQNRWRRDFSQQELFLRRDAHPTPFDPEDRTHLEWLLDVLTAG